MKINYSAFDHTKLLILVFPLLVIAGRLNGQTRQQPGSVLILGNSITKHPPKASIGWSGNWGMAASSPEKDYVHLLIKKFDALRTGTVVNFKNIADWERGYWTYNYNQLDSLADLKPDLIILRLGENVDPQVLQEHNFEAQYAFLVNFFKAKNPDVTILHAASFWKRLPVTEAIKRVSEKLGQDFIDLSGLSADSTNMALGLFKDKGVSRHPSDKGMQAIADIIWKKITTSKSFRLGLSLKPSGLPQLGKSKLTEVTNALTLSEKAHLVIGVGKNNPLDGSDKEKVPGAAGRTYPVKRLGIPSITLADGPAGVRTDHYKISDTLKTFYSTGFPVGVSLASTWNPDLLKQVGRAFGSEVHDYGIDIILAPGLNIQRNPLGGRNFEYYSEDPLLSGTIATGMVQGLQSNQIGTSVKHFIANNQETNRRTVNAVISQRALREIYLKGFETVIKQTQPWTVMSSYNKVNGLYTSESPDLLTTILRNEWNFRGLVMSDWNAGKDVIDQLKAGNDLIMPGKAAQVKEIIKAVQTGRLSVSVLDSSIRRILNLVLCSPSFHQYAFSGKPDLAADAKISREASTEGMVLLKNSSVLPLNSGQKIALFGLCAYKTLPCGYGSGTFNQSYSVSADEGLKSAGYQLDSDLTRKYKDEVEAYNKSIAGGPNYKPHAPEPLISPELIEQTATANNVAIITIGRNSGEGSDLKTGEFGLQDGEKKLLKDVSTAFHAKGKKVLVILNAGFPMETISWRDQVDAILVCWLPGPEGGNAIADIVSGKATPSGKLPVTFPATYVSVPSTKNFPKDDERKPDSSARVKYEEGIYLGYRYYNTFKVPVAYEFGYGLSYTQFTYSDLRLSRTTYLDSIAVTVRITNTGKMPGKEIAELYLKAPAVKLDKPLAELKGFCKTRLLQPGASQTIRWTIKRSDLASFDPAQSAWIAEAGRYVVQVGASSKDIRQQDGFLLANEMLVERVHDVLRPQEPIAEFVNK